MNGEVSFFVALAVAGWAFTLVLITIVAGLWCISGRALAGWKESGELTDECLKELYTCIAALCDMHKRAEKAEAELARWIPVAQKPEAPGLYQVAYKYHTFQSLEYGHRIYNGSEWQTTAMIAYWRNVPPLNAVPEVA